MPERGHLSSRQEVSSCLQDGPGFLGISETEIDTFTTYLDE